ncbi:MAG: FG-GAP-like repeat-containing protein [Cyclobacteriaceae bacterium]
MRSSFARTKVALNLFFTFISLNAVAQITSNFNSNSDSWTAFDNNSGATSAVAYNATGGNPGGYISFTTTANYVPIYFRAPSKFLGNQSFAYNQNLTFDLEVSTAGTDNSNGDVMLISSSGTIYYQLPTKPSTATWSSYSVQMNEANWHYSCPTCSAPSQVQMKQVLSKVTNLQIRLKYLVTTGGAYTSQLDNVILNTVAIGNAPTITSFSPASGLPGSSVIITGTNFNTVASQNSVFFKGIKATVTNASSTQLTVTVPTSAAYGPITVVNNGTQLQAQSTQSFNPLFNNNSDFGGRVVSSTLTPGYNSILQTGTESYNGFGGLDKGDLDGDGWVDLIITDTGAPKIIAYRNLGASGLISPSSFSSAITLPSLSTVPGGGPTLSEVLVVDVNSDGKLDVAASASGNLFSGTSFLAVYVNTSTVGNISFASPVFFAYPYYAALAMTAGDLDSDGRIDFAFTTGSAPGNVWVVQNLSTSGSVDFAYGVAVGTTIAHTDLAIEDLNNDSKPELIVSIGGGIEIYQNNSTPGTIGLIAPFSISVSSGSYISVADLDADNKPDLMWSGYGAGFIYYSQNIFSGSTFNASSFGSPVAISSKLGNPDGLTTCDINGDGKPEIIIVGSSDVGVMQNIGSTGTLSSSSFTSPVIFQGSTSGAYLYGTGPVVADFNGDNKAEVAFVYTNSSISNSEKGVYIFSNESFQPPQITAISPSSAPSGSTITVTGKYLNTKNAIPQVSGIGILSTASNVSNTSLQINAPTGFSDNRISATLHGLQAFSPTQFYTQLNGGLGGAINSSTFGASIDYNLSSFASNPGLVVADLDSNGKPDIIIDDNGTSKIYANTLSVAGASITSGTFTLQAGTLNSASHLKATDLDGDGILDIITNGSFFAGKGISPNPISFSTSASTPIGNSNRILANQDFNLDGKPEVVISNSSNQILVYENFTNKGAPYVYSGGLASLSTSPLTYPNGGTIIGLSAADFDGDGFEDIAYGVNTATSTLSILLNSGSKQIMTASQFSGPSTFTALNNPQYVAVADFNSDGKMDVAMGYYTSSLFISVFMNNSTIGNLSFTRQDFAAVAYCNGLEAGDIDGDGKPEIVTINNPSGSSGSFSIFRNTSSGGVISFSGAVIYLLSSPSVPTMSGVS